jgi:hypothetical protein
VCELTSKNYDKKKRLSMRMLSSIIAVDVRRLWLAVGASAGAFPFVGGANAVVDGVVAVVPGRYGYSAAVDAFPSLATIAVGIAAGALGPIAVGQH